MSRKNFLRDLRTFPQIFLRLNPQTFSLLECMLELLIDKSFCRKTVKLEWDVAFHWHDGRKWLVFAPVNNERAQFGQLSGHTNYLSYVPSPFSRALSPCEILKTARFSLSAIFAGRGLERKWRMDGQKLQDDHWASQLLGSTCSTHYVVVSR